MKEYRVRFNKKPGGPDDEAYFIELEDDQGKSLGGPGTPYVWEDKGDSVVLVLPTYEDKYRIVSKTLSNILNSINWSLNMGVFTGSVFKRIIKEAKDDLSELSEDFIKT